MSRQYAYAPGKYLLVRTHFDCQTAELERLCDSSSAGSSMTVFQPMPDSRLIPVAVGSAADWEEAARAVSSNHIAVAGADADAWELRIMMFVLGYPPSFVVSAFEQQHLVEFVEEWLKAVCRLDQKNHLL